MLWPTLIVFVLILLNGFFAMSELAIVSARRVRLEGMAEAGQPGRGACAEARGGADRVPLHRAGRHHPDRHLRRRLQRRHAVGATGARCCAACRGSAPAPGRVAFAVVVVVTTYLSLIVGELVPKRIALQNAEAIAAAVSGPMTVLARAGKPVVWFLRRLDRGGAAADRPRATPTASAVTEEEVKAMIAEGTDAGVFHEAERDMLEGVIRFADRPVRGIMVPRAGDRLALTPTTRSRRRSTRSPPAGIRAFRSPPPISTRSSASCWSSDMLDLVRRGERRPARRSRASRSTSARGSRP